MLLEKSKRLRETCQKKTITNINSKDLKSRNTLSKVQSRKTYCEMQLNNLKRPSIGKRNSSIYSTVIGDSHSKELISGSKGKQSMVKMRKGNGRLHSDIPGKRRVIMSKRAV